VYVRFALDAGPNSKRDIMVYAPGIRGEVRIFRQKQVNARSYEYFRFFARLKQKKCRCRFSFDCKSESRME
jgi:hypothetical protein